MSTEEITPHDVAPPYYVYVAFTVMHVVVSSLLFVWRRDMFPVKGHNAYLTIFFGVVIAGISAAGAGVGLTTADTCSTGTAVVYLCGIAAGNVVAAQAVRLWFEYNFAEEQLQNLRSDNDPNTPRGWFYRNHKYFKTSRLVVVSIGVSVLEIVVGLVVVFSSVSGFGEPLPCDLLLVVVGIIAVFSLAACTVLVLAYRRLGQKRDGYGIKSGFVKLCVVTLIFLPVIFAIDLVEGFTDLDAYVQAITQTLRFVSANIILAISLGRPVYLSFRDGDHGGLSSVSQDRTNEDGDEPDADNEIGEMISSAADSVEDIELTGASGGAADGSRSASQDKMSTTSSENPASAPEVVSSKTLALSLVDILLIPLYSAQLASFAKHLVGEFDVEPLLFFFKVRSFQKYVSARTSKPAKDNSASSSTCTASVPDKRQNNNEPSISVEECDAGHKNREGGGIDTGDETDIDLASRALQLYFEFMDPDSPSQISIHNRFSTQIFKELSEAIVGFRQLHAHTPCDDLELRRPVDTKVFNKAQKNALELLGRHPYVRWRGAIRDQLDSKLDV